MITPDPDNWSFEELKIFGLFRGRCCLCSKPAVTLHEIVPKSKRPKTWNIPENRIPVCATCHNRIHYDGDNKWTKGLQELRNHATNEG